MFVVCHLVVVTHQIEGIDEVIPPVLGVCAGPHRVIRGLQPLPQLPDVLSSEPGEQAEGQEGVNVEAGGCEDTGHPALVSVVAGLRLVSADHTAEGDGCADSAGDDTLDLGQALLAVGAHPLGVQRPGDRLLPHQGGPHRDVLPRHHKPAPALLMLDIQAGAGRWKLLMGPVWMITKVVI